MPHDFFNEKFLLYLDFNEIYLCFHSDWSTLYFHYLDYLYVFNVMFGNKKNKMSFYHLEFF